MSLEVAEWEVRSVEPVCEIPQTLAVRCVHLATDGKLHPEDAIPRGSRANIRRWSSNSYLSTISRADNGPGRRCDCECHCTRNVVFGPARQRVFLGRNVPLVSHRVG